MGLRCTRRGTLSSRAFGSKTRKMIAGINGDDTAGGADIENASHLAEVDRIAICAAGMLAQDMLDAATHEIAGLSDEVLLIVADYDDAEEEAIRDAGFSKSWETLETYRAAVERLAAALAEHGELDHDAIERILADDTE